MHCVRMYSRSYEAFSISSQPLFHRPQLFSSPGGLNLAVDISKTLIPNVPEWIAFQVLRPFPNSFRSSFNRSLSLPNLLSTSETLYHITTVVFVCNHNNADYQSTVRPGGRVAAADYI